MCAFHLWQFFHIDKNPPVFVRNTKWLQAPPRSKWKPRRKQSRDCQSKYWPLACTSYLLLQIQLCTDKSLSEALILSTDPQYDNRLFIELLFHYIKIPSSEHGEIMLCTQIVFCFCFDIQNNLWKQHVLHMFSLCSPHVLSLEFLCSELVIHLTIFCQIVG